ncbi:MAG: hypothetical protein JW888_06345 [Pirellulales bacterium]|nr:hypothetical protein [Pirellulales bacterium]
MKALPRTMTHATLRHPGTGDAPARPGPESTSRTAPKCVRAALCCYLLTLALVVVGFSIGLGCLRPGGKTSDAAGQSFSRELRDVATRWDGAWYLGIVTKGYRYNPERHSSVAFFPAYPLIGAAVRRTTGLPADVALVLVANVCLVASFGLFCRYARRRFGEQSDRMTPWSLLAMALFPAAFFMCMVYGESLFLLLCLLAMYGIECKWRPLLIAVVVGFATAVRPVGVALIVPLILDAWARAESRRGAIATCVWLVPVGCWGLLGYMAFQQVAFDDPLAFVQTQGWWSLRPAVDGIEKALCLASGEPMWSLYVPSSAGYWAKHEGPRCVWFSLHAANPVYFLAAVVLVYVGAVKRWLSRYEVALAVGLLAIPYIARGFEMCMASHARFAAVVFPIYLVLGHLLGRAPRWMAVGVLVLSGVFLVVYSAGMAGGYRTF